MPAIPTDEGPQGIHGQITEMNSLCLVLFDVDNMPFWQITVDGDTSTNDTVLGLASGAAGGPIISDPASPEAQQLESAVTALLQVCDTAGVLRCLC
jgi:N-acetylglutamate synthase/N-acetylornithine aminotransferase